VRLVVADTGPLHYLIQVAAVSVLPKMVDAVFVPSLVLAELTADGAPVEVRAWASELPTWVEVRTGGLKAVVDPEISLADAEAIALAAELETLLLIDDRRARKAAQERGIVTIGTVGILETAAAKRLISLPDAFERLRRTNMFVSEELLARALARDRLRRGVTEAVDPDSSPADSTET